MVSFYTEINSRFDQKKYDVFTRMIREEQWMELYRQFEIRLSIISQIDLYRKVDSGEDDGVAGDFHVNGCEAAVYLFREPIESLLRGEVILDCDVAGKLSTCHEVAPEESEEFNSYQQIYKKEYQAKVIAIPNGLTPEALLSQLADIVKIKTGPNKSPETLIRKVLIHQKWLMLADIYIYQCALWFTPFGKKGKRFLLTYREILTLIYPPEHDVSTDTIRQTILPNFERGLSSDFRHKFFSFTMG